MNCSRIAYFNNGNEAVGYDIIINGWLLQAPYNVSHANFISFFQLVIIQILSLIVLSKLKNVYKYIKKNYSNILNDLLSEFPKLIFICMILLYLFYFLSVVYFGHLFWEKAEQFFDITGEFYCSRDVNCGWIMRKLLWFRETKLNMNLDLYHGEICTIFFLYLQIQCGLHIWTIYPNMGLFIFKRILVVIFHGLATNNFGSFYIRFQCGTQEPTDFYVGYFIVFALYFLTVYFWKNEEINLSKSEKKKEKIRKFYNAWYIYFLIQLLFNLIPIGSMICIHFAWLTLFFIFSIFHNKLFK
jgi:hypothetical protein